MTLDVTSLYTNDPHEEGMEACHELLNTRKVLDPPMNDIINLMNLVLKKNSFTFYGAYYLQNHGTAIGTQMSPYYANVFVGKLESDLLQRAEKETNGQVEIHT